MKWVAVCLAAIAVILAVGLYGTIRASSDCRERGGVPVRGVEITASVICLNVKELK